MPAHWTYDDVKPDSDLEQGDILRPSDELMAVFRGVHPHFCDDKYLGFLLATQSCDLARRRGDIPKARYISLCTIRPLNSVLKKLVSQVVRPVSDRFFPSSGKDGARQLLERIFNQNEQTNGIFFLHEDSDSGISDMAVAMLRVSVSVRSDHYQTLVDARTGRLKPAFQAKLGWLLGNLYDRPATPDWGDNPAQESKLKKMISLHLNSNNADTSGTGITWVDDVLIEEARSKGIPIEELSLERLEEFRPRTALEKALDEIDRELGKVLTGLQRQQSTAGVEGQDFGKVLNRLGNNSRFQKVLAAKVRAGLKREQPAAGLEERRFRKVLNRLRNNPRFQKVLITKVLASLKREQPKVGLQEQQFSKVLNRLKNNPRFQELFRARTDRN